MSLPPDLPPFEPPVPPVPPTSGELPVPVSPPSSDAHAWVSDPASAASKSQSKTGALIVVVLVVALVALIFVAVKLGGSVLNRIDFSLADVTRGVDTSEPAAAAAS